MATNYNEKKRIVESMIKEERMSRFACELGSPVAVKVNMKQNTLIVFITFVFFSRSRIPNSFFLSMNERQSSASSSNLFFCGSRKWIYFFSDT